ncbi:MAG: DUF4430 domain-containing protein [Calditrichaeota bacterium]|nr:MAG: DUF4430 domain-containing protein [Calditrichota bacterium]
MRKKWAFGACFLTFLMLPTVSGQLFPAGLNSQKPAQKVPVAIIVRPDNLNVLEAHIWVKAGTNARDLMMRLFQIKFADRGRRFVTAIAGFQANSRKREFWSLKVDSTVSNVGIAEIIINEPSTIEWQKKFY